MCNLLGQSLSSQTILLTSNESLVAGLQQVGRGQEGVVTVEGVHEREVVLVQVHGLSEVGELIVDHISQLGLGQKARLSGQGLDWHALEDILKSVKLLGKSDDGLRPGEEAPGGGDHKGREGEVIRTGVVQDAEGRVAGGNGTHLWSWGWLWRQAG